MAGEIEKYSQLLLSANERFYLPKKMFPQETHVMLQTKISCVLKTAGPRLNYDTNEVHLPLPQPKYGPLLSNCLMSFTL